MWYLWCYLPKNLWSNMSKAYTKYERDSYKKLDNIWRFLLLYFQRWRKTLIDGKEIRATLRLCKYFILWNEYCKLKSLFYILYCITLLDIKNFYCLNTVPITLKNKQMCTIIFEVIFLYHWKYKTKFPIIAQFK